METLFKYMNKPTEKSLSTRCREYIVNNPTAIAQAIPVAIVGWYSLPVIIAICNWAPWLYIGYKIHRKTQLVRDAYTFVQQYNPFI